MIDSNIIFFVTLVIEKINPSRPNPGRREKIKLNFCLHSKGFEAPQRSENKDLSEFLFQYNFQECTGLIRYVHDSADVIQKTH